MIEAKRSVTKGSQGISQRISQGTKSFSISQSEVQEAFEKVKANKGAPGVDGQSIKEFEKDLHGNLYKLWNRMSSGSYFPPAVRRVMIPKADGGKRPLGIPTVADRVAQTVVKSRLESVLEPHFLPDSYGYRPGKSALEAVSHARQRCWKFDWVLDLDIKGFFDNIDHDLLMRALKKHTREPWMLLYIERWLKAPVADEQGVLTDRVQGTPQGGVISPLLANLFLHYAFDKWMRKHYPHLPFERYADDAIVHCRTEAEAVGLWAALKERMQACGLELHPDKTKVVFCKADNRPGNYQHEQFTFLGYTFRPRSVKSRAGKLFVGFTPAVSPRAGKSIRAKIRKWKLHRRSDLSLEDMACTCNPVLRGWIQYYGRFRPSALAPIFRQLDYALVRWAIRKYKWLRGAQQASKWLNRIIRRDQKLFAHWTLQDHTRSTVGAV